MSSCWDQGGHYPEDKLSKWVQEESITENKIRKVIPDPAGDDPNPLFSKRFIDGFSPVLHMELFINIVNMLPYGAGTDLQPVSYFLIQ